MYRINLHPEFAAGRTAQKRRIMLTSLGVALIGAEALLVGSLLLSASLLDERVQAMQTATERLEADARGAARHDQADVALARAILQIRSQRVDWAPQLAALSERIGPRLILTSLLGESRAGRARPSLKLEGLFRNSTADLEAATAFAAALREDERISITFPRCEVDRVREIPSPGFIVSCQAPASSAEGAQ